MQPPNVQKLPQTAPISDMRNRQNELLRMTEEGPVLLMSRSKPSAILLSPAYWDAIAEMLQAVQQPSRVQQGPSVTDEPQVNAKNGAMNTLDHRESQPSDVDALAEIAAMAQPLGPADLALNFDSYTEQVLDDDTAE